MEEGFMAGSKQANISIGLAQYRDPEFLRAMLIGLTIDCPLDRNFDQCPLRLDRSTSFDEKIAWAESLTGREIMDLYAVHHQCFQSK